MTGSLALPRKAVLASWRPLLTAFALLGVMEIAKHANLLPVFVPSPTQVVMDFWRPPRLVTENLAPTAWKSSLGFAIAAVVATIVRSLAASTPPSSPPLTHAP